MKALVVYESMFGNTQAVAEAVADGLSATMQVDLRDVSEAPTPATEDVDLIVLGGPTHAFSLSRASTRAEAIKQGATHGSEEVGLREWLAHLERGPHSQLVATFDTRSDQVRHLPGSAAKKAARLTRRQGYPRAETESFYVADTAGPLDPGELDRAKGWGARLGAQAAARSGQGTGGS
ncbi:MAG: flavodoxin family protein [Nocardioidaceae bacterium]